MGGCDGRTDGVICMGWMDVWNRWMDLGWMGSEGMDWMDGFDGYDGCKGWMG